MKINISYSQKANRSNGVQPWAAASIEREFPEELFAKPSLLFAEMRQTYAIAEAAVAEQLENAAPDEGPGPGDVRSGEPVRDRMRQAPPASARSIAPAPSSSSSPSPSAPPSVALAVESERLERRPADDRSRVGGLGQEAWPDQVVQRAGPQARPPASGTALRVVE